MPRSGGYGFDVYRFVRSPRWLGFALLCVLVSLACVRLGFWQLSRYESRSASNAHVDRNASAAPVPVDRVLEVGGTVTSSEEWRRVKATGTYDVQHQLVVRQRPLNGQNGFQVLTPLRTQAGPVLVVDRGWVPSGATARTAPDVPAPPSGTVTVVGLVRASEDGALRSSDLPPGQVRNITVPQIGQLLGQPVYDGYLQLSSEQPAPAQSLTALPLEDDAPSLLNLAYTVQWWIFAGIALAGYGIFVRREARDRAERSAGATDVREATRTS